MLAFVNETFLPVEQAFLQVGDLAIQRGYGVFDFFRVHNRVPLYINDYLDRFYYSAKIMGLQCHLDREKGRIDNGSDRPFSRRYEWCEVKPED